MKFLYLIKRTLTSILPPPISKYLKYRRFISHGLHDEMWGGGKYYDNLERALSLNIPKDKYNDQSYIKLLRKDIIKSYLFLEATPEEYFAFGFEHKPLRERKKYLTNMTKDKILLSKVSQEHIYRLRDKYKLYSMLPDLFKRHICVIESPEDRNHYFEFVSKFPRYFVKPIDGMCGRGTAIINGNNFDELLASGKWIIEEVIQQSSILAQFNQTSVNTVRLPTFLKGGKFTPIAPFFRTGRAGSIVDNGGAGGIFAAIDVNSGTIMSNGINEDNQEFFVHPDSGIKFMGFEIPEWQSLLKIAEEAHRRLSDQRYIAWDFAYTPNGWILVEANSMGQFIWQYPTKIGIKKEFMQLMS